MPIPKAILNIISHRELLSALALKDLRVRYKQAYFGIAWSVLRPLLLVAIFILVRSFVGIDSGATPYPVLTFAALIPWVFFQEATTDCIHSIVANAMLVRKIYFPREIFLYSALAGKLVELAINLLLLTVLMPIFHITPSIHILWLPLLVAYAMAASLAIGLIGATLNIFYRDIGSLLPIALSVLMYLSPIIYPLSLVQRTLLVEHKAGTWSSALYFLYTCNPLAGMIDAFQRTLLQQAPPAPASLLPGVLLTGVLLTIGYSAFKRFEPEFADVI
ncbi:MAG: ABC transporter permease [Thermodesulfobacteriota bacterium]